MIATFLTLAVCAVAFALSQWWWRTHINPVSIGVLAWTPALIMLNWPPFFLSSYYIHLNRPVSPLVYLAMALSFLSFWAGCAIVKALSKKDAFDFVPARLKLNFSIPRAMILYGIGVGIFIYSYLNSGLLDLANLDETQVAESRISLHLGIVSFFGLFMDVIAMAMFARFLQTSRWLYMVPMVVAILCQAATLQKSTFMFLVISCIFIAMLHPRATMRLFWSNVLNRTAVVLFGLAVSVTLLAMNEARGIAVVQMTAASSPILEQIYIYSGASAIMNVSVTLDGYLPTDPPAMGLYLARPVLWHFVDRDLIFATRYFEGVNGATYMIYGWADFWWVGFVITPLLTGMIAMFFLRLALGGTVAGLIFGVVQAKAVILSANTDVIFDPTTSILLTIAILAHLFTRMRKPAPLALPGPGRYQAGRSARPSSPMGV